MHRFGLWSTCLPRVHLPGLWRLSEDKQSANTFNNIQTKDSDILYVKPTSNKKIAVQEQL